MSFETTVGFLADAVTDGDWDDLSSPSSRIVIGRMSKVGTGSFGVLTRVPTKKGDETII
jgi:DNA-directed RNA polymerase I subunit RPA1